MLSQPAVIAVFTLLTLTSPGKSAAMAPRLEADNSNTRMKRTDDVSLSSLQTLVQQQQTMLSQQQAVLDQQASAIQSVQAELAASRNEIRSLQSSLSSLQNRLDATSTAVAFSARISGDQDTMDDGVSLGHLQTVVFNEAINNIGNAYNTNNGIFTAPVAGSYAFFLNQMTPNQHNGLALAITKNGDTILDRVYSAGHDGNAVFEQGSSLVTTHLVVGDQVWVRQSYGDAVRGDHWTIFSGFLLQAD